MANQTDITLPYELQVRKLAEEMAVKAKPSILWRYNPAGIAYTPAEMHKKYETAVKQCIPLAEIAMKKAARAFEQGFYIDPSEYDGPTLAVPRLLVENGFVPEPTAESLLIPKRRKK